MASKTILQALQDEVHYPVGLGYLENKLLARGLDTNGIITADVLRSTAFIGAVADCLMSLAEAPNYSEGDKSVSYSNKDIILKRANALYRSIGEDNKVAQEARPKVTILS